MTTKFNVKTCREPKDDFFDRQSRIDWWSQERLRKAKVFVVGSGAIGNETIKNLVLLGVGEIYIADFDIIEASNLSRTTLFRTRDVGRKKAEVAAQQAFAMRLEESSQLFWFHGDVVWEVGTGFYREMDLVLGCLDNVETRLAVNRHCQLANVPWIDAGISQLACHVTPYEASGAVCYQCHISRHQIAAVRQRYSCDNFKRANFQAGRVPTVQVASALVSALQTQESIKLLCGQRVRFGTKLFFDGLSNEFLHINLLANDTCSAHMRYPAVTTLPGTLMITVKELIQRVAAEEEVDPAVITVELGDDREFVRQISCKICSCVITLNRPVFRIFDHEAICVDCRLGTSPDSAPSNQNPLPPINRFRLSETPTEILSMTLQAIGFPWHPVIPAMIGSETEHRYYVLSEGHQGMFQSLPAGMTVTSPVDWGAVTVGSDPCHHNI